MTGTDAQVQIRQMKKENIAGAADLVARAMNENEGKWADKTMNFHFECMEKGMDDGRDYYLWWQNENIRGIVGLHHYEWGPPENVWLAWFAVDPMLQGQGFGKRLLDAVHEKAGDLGYQKFFIETYLHPDFEKAIRFYKKYGFTEHGRIDNYLPDGSQMLVLGKSI
jgi:GNAT superfamily N-acetyltransferase